MNEPESGKVGMEKRYAPFYGCYFDCDGADPEATNAELSRSRPDKAF